jgi:osmotically-inducible protein OsmY
MSLSKFGPALLVLGIAAATPVMEGCRTNQSVSSQISDSSITAAVKSKLVGDKQVAARNVDVNTEEGIVYLMGRVGSQAEKAEAERLARTVDGVRDVVNHLQVGSN